MTSPTAPWAEVGEGHFARSLGPSEKLSLPAILAPGPRESHRIHAFADFSYPKEETTIEEVYTAFAQAWTSLRVLESPEIACTYDSQDGMMHYKSPSRDELYDWQRQTFLLAKSESTVEEVVVRFQQQLQPLPTCCLISRTTQGTRRRQATLLLLISHWRTEASGAFLIINRLFQYAADFLSKGSLMADVPLGAELNLLTPCLEDLMVTREDQESKRRIEALFKRHNDHLPSLALPVLAPPSQVTPSSLVQHQRIYSTTSSSSLAQTCRSLGLSVSSLIHSAYVGSVYSQSSSGQQRRNYASIMPVQLRTRLNPSSPHRSKGCWNSAQLIFVSSPPDLSLVDRAKHLREQYRLADDDTWQHADLREMSEQMLRHTTETPIQSGAEGLPFITSMGIVDSALSPKHGAALTIDTISVWADSLGPGIVLSLWSFRGQLNLQITWNRAYHAVDQVDAILDGMERTLASESGINLHVDEKRIRTF